LNKIIEEIKPFKSINIITHDGSSHLDETLAIAMLKRYFTICSIIRAPRAMNVDEANEHIESGIYPTFVIDYGFMDTLDCTDFFFK